jgi:hypothetical protein
MGSATRVSTLVVAYVSIVGDMREFGGVSAMSANGCGLVLDHHDISVYLTDHL